MKKWIIPYIGYANSLIGISGIVGAIECQTGFMQSVSLLIAGTMILYLEYKNESEVIENVRTSKNLR